jgi:heme oxygenase (mycobilin-producing)
MEAHSGERGKPVASGSSLLEFEVVQTADPSSAPTD